MQYSRRYIAEDFFSKGRGKTEKHGKQKLKERGGFQLSFCILHKETGGNHQGENRRAIYHFILTLPSKLVSSKVGRASRTTNEFQIGTYSQSDRPGALRIPKPINPNSPHPMYIGERESSEIVFENLRNDQNVSAYMKRSCYIRYEGREGKKMTGQLRALQEYREFEV